MQSVPTDDIKFRIALIGITREQVARSSGYDPSLFSRILNGLRPPPADFREKVNAVLDREEAVKKELQEAEEKVRKEWADQEARERVLREGAT